jgi:CRISPR-associated protein (TIGR02584 family)
MSSRATEDFNPARYPRRVLLCAAGLTPQIVTETLYALAVTPERGRDPFIPTEIHVVTTTVGAKRIQLELLRAHEGQFFRLCTDYGLDAATIRFDPSTLHVMSNGNTALDDITTVEDSTAAADFIVSKVRELTLDSNCALHVSLAGGRKTMGYLIAYGLSLFGRPQDRLSHVLVTADFESHPDFFFPPKTSRVLHTRQARPRDDKPIDTADAEIVLAEMPFVRMRDGLDPSLLDGSASYSEIIERAQRAQRAPLMELNLTDRVVLCAGIPVHLGWKEFTLLVLLARRIVDRLPPLTALKAGNAKDFAETFRRIYLDLKGEGDQDTLVKSLDKLIARLRSAEAITNLQQEYLTHPRTLIAKAMRRELGLTLAKHYTPENQKDARTGKKNKLGYTLPLGAYQIRFVNRPRF